MAGGGTERLAGLIRGVVHEDIERADTREHLGFLTRVPRIDHDRVCAQVVRESLRRIALLHCVYPHPRPLAAKRGAIAAHRIPLADVEVFFPRTVCGDHRSAYAPMFVMQRGVQPRSCS